MNEFMKEKADAAANKKKQADAAANKETFKQQASMLDEKGKVLESSQKILGSISKMYEDQTAGVVNMNKAAMQATQASMASAMSVASKAPNLQYTDLIDSS